MDHDTGVVLIFVIFFALLIFGLLWFFAKNRGRLQHRRDGSAEFPEKSGSRISDFDERYDNANPASPLWRKRHHDRS